MQSLFPAFTPAKTAKEADSSGREVSIATASCKDGGWHCWHIHMAICSIQKANEDVEEGEQRFNSFQLNGI